LTQGLAGLTDYLILPQATPGADPSWFGYPVSIKTDKGFNRAELINFLDQAKIGTRLLFAGNLTRQPYFQSLNYRVAGELTVTDHIMSHTFWIGLYPGLTSDHLDFTIRRFYEFFRQLEAKN
jgi:CDP-6-deoxy-D-xylo-4-hexulose-3-dehydrase